MEKKPSSLVKLAREIMESYVRRISQLDPWDDTLSEYVEITWAYIEGMAEEVAIPALESCDIEAFKLLLDDHLWHNVTETVPYWDYICDKLFDYCLLDPEGPCHGFFRDMCEPILELAGLGIEHAKKPWSTAVRMLCEDNVGAIFEAMDLHECEILAGRRCRERLRKIFKCFYDAGVEVPFSLCRDED